MRIETEQSAAAPAARPFPQARPRRTPYTKSKPGHRRHARLSALKPHVLPHSGRTTGARALVEALLAQGVTTVFGYPGGQIMPVYDALYDVSDKLHHVLVRHEQGAAHAAEGYARAAGRTGVCLATSGPGATNLVTGIADAMLDSVPIVCITGQVPSTLLGKDAFQEVDMIGITMPITKWNCQITTATEIPAMVARAFEIAASGRPGPVLLDITKDAQAGEINWAEIPRAAAAAVSEKPLDCEAVTRAAAIINGAKRPLLVTGGGAVSSGAARELLDLAEKAGIPMASTLMGLSACPTRHPLYFGMVGMHGNIGPNMLTNEADVIITVGARFSDRVTGNTRAYAPRAAIVQIEIDPAEVGKNVRPAAVLAADAKAALGRLLPLVRGNRHPEWIARFREAAAREHAEVVRAALYPGAGRLRMGEVIREITRQTEGDAVMVADVGQNQMMTARYAHFNRARSFITSGGLGTMGFALPAAIGAALGRPQREVIAVCGDGSMQMNIQELGTLAQEDLPVKIVVLNNSYLGMVRQWQELFFERRYAATPITSPDFVTVCRGYGIEAACVEKRVDLEAAVAAMRAAEGPYLLEVRVEQEENVFPMIPPGAAVTDLRTK